MRDYAIEITKRHILKLKKLRAFISFLIIGSFLLPTHSTSLAATVLSGYLTEGVTDSVSVGVKGSFLEDAADYVKRINKLRKEACEKGYPDPRNSSRKLTASDYVEIQWSSGLQSIARIRAAEASIETSHTRPNGKSCFSITMNEINSSAEVLAWGGDGIELWAGEKDDWISQNDNAVTGHYTSMINPNNLYVGIGYFSSETGAWGSTYAGEFSSETGLDSTPLSNIKNCIQTIDVEKKNISKTAVMIDNGDSLLVGKTAECYVTYQYKSSSGSVFYMGKTQWTSSEPSVAVIDENGVITLKGYGKVKFTAKLEDGTKVSVTKNFAKPVQAVKIRSVKSGKRSLKIKWKQGNSSTKGYVIELSTSKKFKKNYRWVFVSGRKKTSTTVYGLLSKKKYYVRISAYDKNYNYSKKSAVKTKKTK